MAFDNSILSWLTRILGGPIFGGIQLYKDLKSVKDDRETSNSRSVADQVRSGELSAEQALGQLAVSGDKLSPEVESYLNNMLANQRTNEARDYETGMANTDILRAASQLSALGLGPSNVLSTGGSATPNVSAAGVMASNNANQRYNRDVALANTMISMAGRLASSGIYGSALKAVKETSAKMAAAAAHSAKVIRNYDKFGELTSETEITGTSSRHVGDLFDF